MPQAILERVKGQLSSELDDYFRENDLLDYINEGYKSVISQANKLEIGRPKKQGRSIRALDALRKTVEVSGLSFTKDQFQYIADIDLAAEIGTETLDIRFVGATVNGDPLNMSEILPERKHERSWGLLHPSPLQGYYEFINDQDTDLLRTYFADNVASTSVQVDYIAMPGTIDNVMTTLPDLPDRLIQAVIMKACLLAGVQEIRENSKDFASLYKSETQVHLW